MHRFGGFFTKAATSFGSDELTSPVLGIAALAPRMRITMKAIWQQVGKKQIQGTNDQVEGDVAKWRADGPDASVVE
jgi:hypothetical protein